MIFFGIDPGTAITGYGVVELEGSRRYHLAHGVIRTPFGMPIQQRLSTLHDGLCTLLGRYKPECMAMEELFFSNNAKTAIAVAQSQGVILLESSRRKLPIHTYTPNQVKLAVTQNGRAGKREVQVMVQRLLGLEQMPTPDDAADALAVALCATQEPRWLTYARVR